jgi:hypothetical protein
MSDKSSGLDFDRQLFEQPQVPASRPAPRVSGILLALAVIAAMVFVAYKLIPQIGKESASASNPALTDLDKRLVAIEGRLEKLEAVRRGAVSTQKETSADAKDTSSKLPAKTIYQISPTTRQPDRAVPARPAASDSATAQRLATLQQGLGALQSDQTANHEAWQATTDRLAEMAGQVGTQGVAILQNQDQINQLLAHTEMEAIPFELRRGGDPQPVGPVSLALKSANPKSHRYTLCVYIQPSCVDLKDRTLNEVVQFVLVRNSMPLEVIATKIMKDEILGYVEAPRHHSER